MLPPHAEQSEHLPVVTPLRWRAWEDELQAAGCLDNFADVPYGIRYGFKLGVESTIDSTYIPPNHKSALNQTEAVDMYIQKELAARRCTGPYDPGRLRKIIGNVRSSAIGTVPKGEGFRVIRDMSYPRREPGVQSVNAEINADDFPCEWGTFAECALLVAQAPPGTEVAVFDVQAAYRCIPIWPEDQRHNIFSWRGMLYIDHCATFGCASSNGLFGQPADSIVRIFRHHGVEDVLKWVDDFIFFRRPIPGPEGQYKFSYNEKLIWDLADKLGWLWAPDKHTPFNNTFMYIGFTWDLVSKTVQIPTEKKQKYLRRLEEWTVGSAVTRKVCEAAIGMLNHCCLAVPNGRSHMTALYSEGQN
jgi:hypothetical protein